MGYNSVGSDLYNFAPERKCRFHPLHGVIIGEAISVIIDEAISVTVTFCQSFDPFETGPGQFYSVVPTSRWIIIGCSDRLVGYARKEAPAKTITR